MKKILLLFVIPAIVGIGNRLQAQCDLQFNNLVIQIVSANPYPDPVTGPNCEAVFNASFDITTNSGFKYLFFHSWLAADYPNPPVFDCSNSNAVDPGTSAQLGTVVDQPGKSFLDIGFIGLKDFLAGVPLNTPTNVTSLFATTYLHDNTVVLTQPSNSPGLNAIVTKLAGDILHFDVTNIRIVINQPCGGPLAVKTDIWGSNSNAGDPKAQCYICGLSQFFNDPVITGFKNCNNPRQYTLGINTVDPVVDEITYKVYLDVNGNGTLETGTDQLAFTSGTISISAPGGPAPDGYSTGGPISLPSPYSDSQPWSEMGYLILVEFVPPTTKNSIVAFFPHPEGCIGLPVSFKSFTAARNRTNVLLKWETYFEQNNSGFAVERNIRGTWEQVAFVPTQAPDGNSLDPLTYLFNDLNHIRGITQYRIKQVDQDGKFRYSVIRAVRGEGQIGKTIIFPNPSRDGNVTVVFEDASVSRDVSVIDMSGRIIKQWKGVTNNNLQIDNLVPGVFSVRISIPETGEQVVEKIVVSKR